MLSGGGQPLNRSNIRETAYKDKKDFTLATESHYGVQKKAFTLAEVLITLTILGVVAAIAVPNLIQNYQKRVTVTKLAKAYSTLEGALNNIAVNTDCVGKDLKCTGLLEDGVDVNETFMKFSGIREVKSTQKWYIPGSLGCYKDKGTCLSTGPQHSIRFYTADNIGYNFYTYYPFKSMNNSDVYSKAIIAMILTDSKQQSGGTALNRNQDHILAINGINVFYFAIYGNFMVKPLAYYNAAVYYPMESSVNDCTFNNARSYGCSARIIRDGWKIKYY